MTPVRSNRNASSRDQKYAGNIEPEAKSCSSAWVLPALGRARLIGNPDLADSASDTSSDRKTCGRECEAGSSVRIWVRHIGAALNVNFNSSLAIRVG